MQPQTPTSVDIDSVNTVSMSFMCVRALRAIVYTVCVIFGVWAYSNPETVVETVTTIDIDAQESQLNDLTYVIALVTNSSATTIPDMNAFLKVFVRVFVTLFIVAVSDIPSRRDRMSRILALAGYLLALGLFMDVSIRDSGDILRAWFVAVYAIFVCAVPAIVCGIEARFPGMVLWC